MAKKFFTQKVHNRRKTITQIIIIIICVIGIAGCFVAAHYFNNRLPKGAVAKIRDSVAIEVHGDLPEKTTFFSELENINEKDITVDYTGVNPDKVGDYNIQIKIYKKKYQVILKVVDTFSPELTVKNFSILETETYSAEDFVENCTDNSDQKCIVEFYDLATDQDGNKIDYSAYKAVGSYKVQIIAKDDSGNQTAPTEATLIINKDPNGNGNSNTQNPNTDTPQQPSTNQTCKYGNADYDTDKYILANIVAENNCAVDLNLYQDEALMKGVNEIMENETKKIMNEFKKLSVNNDVTVNRKKQPVLNTTGKGVVGYSLEIEIYENINDKYELVESYFLKLDGSRVFNVNKYNLK